MFASNVRSFVLAASIRATLVCGGCGDVSRLKVTLRFPDVDTSEATRQLLFVIREPTREGDPCDALWGDQPGELAEYTSLVPYPNRTDLVAAPLDVGQYTIMVYGYGTALDRLCDADEKCETSTMGKFCRPVGGGKNGCVSADAPLEPLAGGCYGGAVVEMNRASEIVLTLEKR